MILATHVIFGTYGFWLPNDPRGSWSDFIGSWELYRHGGPAIKPQTTRSVAHAPHDVRQRLEMKKHLKNHPVVFNDEQIQAVARGFAMLEHPVYACAILPEHVHMVLGRCPFEITKVVRQFKQQATIQLKKEGFTFPDSPWARGMWKVYLDTSEAVVRAIHYAEQNPPKDGKPLQNWPFITPFRPF